MDPISQGEAMEPDDNESLPAIDSPLAWMSILGILALLVLINVVAFLVSFGAGVIVTLPITLFLAFLLLRNAVPRNRLPSGRHNRGTPA